MPVYKQIEGNHRAIIGEFEFDLAPQDVWRALTDPEEIANWFSLRARVEGKVNGEIQFDWKPLFDFEWIDRITIWEPDKRLAFAPRPETVAKEGLDYLCEFVITTGKGKTKLTMVHSGFSTDAKWDDEFDSYFGGWNYELFSLSHYLTHHFGKQRRLIWTALNYAEHGITNPYKHLADSTGLFAEKSLRGFKVGDTFRFPLNESEIIQGKVVQLEPDGHDQFAGVIESLNQGLFRIGAGQRFFFAWLALYDMDEQRAVKIEKLFHERFAAALAQPA